MREWLYYNFAAGSFYRKKLCSRLYWTEIELHAKKKKSSHFKRPFGDLRVRISSIARWKARGRVPIRHNWTFFATSYGWDVISGNLSKEAFFERGWVILSANFRRKRASPANHCQYQKTRVIAQVSCGIKVCAVHCLVWWRKTRVTDGRTE